jgi:hypothetical protein
MKYQKILFVLGLTVLNLCAFHYFQFYKRFVSGGDSWGYYTHLVSTFIYHDIGDYHATAAGSKEQFPDFGDQFSNGYGVLHQAPTGKYVTKYTNGVALMLSPFFGLAHLYVKLSHKYLANGFSTPYLLAIGWGVIFWLSLSYYYLITVLRRYFSKWVTGITLFTLAFATNLFYNTTYNSIMSHALLFACYAFLIYNTDTYYKNPNQRRLILLAFSAAMLSLLRLNEIYCILIPLLWNVTDFTSLKARFQWIFQNIKQYLIAALCASIVFVPQIIYWKKLTGKFIYDGYIKEYFDFKHPHIYDGWFDYGNGWLVWSPVMVISLLGIIVLRRYAKAAFLPLILLLPLHVYIIYSWWCYHYINGFGSRPMEHLYPILAFSMASFLAFMFQRKWTTGLTLVFITGCIGLNLFQVWQQHSGIIFTEMTNRGFYWGIFGQTKPTRNAIVGYASNEIQNDNIKVLKTIYTADFEDTTNTKNVRQPQHNSPMRCLTLSSDTIATIDIGDKLDATHFNIKLKALFHADAVNGDVWSLPMLIFRFQDANGKQLCESTIKPHFLIGNTENIIWTQGKPDICQPIEWNMKIHRRSKLAKVFICTWNPLAKPLYIDDFQIALAK